MHFVGIQQEQRGMKYIYIYIYLIIYTSASFSATNSLPLTILNTPNLPPRKKTNTCFLSQKHKHKQGIFLGIFHQPRLAEWQKGQEILQLLWKERASKLRGRISGKLHHLRMRMLPNQWMIYCTYNKHRSMTGWNIKEKTFSIFK